MNMDYKAMGRRIAALRKSKKITQEKMAELCEVCTQYYSRIECGRAKPTLDKLVNIANILECTLDELLCDSVKSDVHYIINEADEVFSLCNAEEKKLLAAQLKLMYDFMKKVEKTK